MRTDQDLERLHSDVLFTQVRVRTAKTGGSGTILASLRQKETYETYAIPCAHVIDDAISIKTEWDPRVGRERKREYRQLVGVEFFDFSNAPHGHRPVTYSADADVLCYDKTHDMALLRLRTIKPADYCARLLGPAQLASIQVGKAVVAVGCSLGHDPILTEGMITHMGDEIDFKRYMMTSAAIIFGNSGGAVFMDTPAGWSFIGIPSRIDVIGWGTPITHLGYMSPVGRVYEFLTEQLFHFLIPDHAHTPADCEAERQARQEQEERRLILERPEGH